MKFFQFLVEVKNELAKVIWPNRRETVRYTITVILFSLGIAFILGAADLGLLEVFERIIQK